MPQSAVYARFASGEAHHDPFSPFECQGRTRRSRPVPVFGAEIFTPSDDHGRCSLLSACASGPQRPQIPVAQEAADYREHAKSYYAPPGPPEDPWGPYIEEASQRFDVPGTWIRSVMMQESGGRLYDRNGQFTTSAPGAMG